MVPLESPLVIGGLIGFLLLSGGWPTQIVPPSFFACVFLSPTCLGRCGPLTLGLIRCLFLTFFGQG